VRVWYASHLETASRLLTVAWLFSISASSRESHRSRMDLADFLRDTGIPRESIFTLIYDKTKSYKYISFRNNRTSYVIVDNKEKK